MTLWHFTITSSAEKSLDKLDRPVRLVVVEKLKWFVANFETLSPSSLHGEWKAFFKLRIGDWRVIYEKDDANKMIVVHSIGHRREVYKRK